MAGRYRIDQLLGEGGMGAVYRALHVHMQKTVAIKIMHQQMTAVEGAAKRFEREAIAAARIEHANVATAIDFGQLDGGSFYFVLEYLQGQTLAKLLATRRALPVEKCVFIARQIAVALSAAHTVGIVHRDLKPDNVMLIEKDGVSDHVKVLDFGIAKIAADASHGSAQLTRTGTVFGTPRYMSPEQAAGRAVDARADLYALGLIVHEMLSGKPVFDADELVALLVMQMTQAPAALPARVPVELSRLVMQLLEKEPANRPQSAEQVIRSIDALSDRSASQSVSDAHPASATPENAISSRPKLRLGAWYESALGRTKSVLGRAVPSGRPLRALFERRSPKPLTKRVLATVANAAIPRRSIHGRVGSWRESIFGRAKTGVRRVAARARKLLVFAKQRAFGPVPNWVWAAIGVTALGLIVAVRALYSKSEIEAQGLPESGRHKTEEGRQLPAGEAELDPRLQRLIAEARQGTQSALYALELRSEQQRSKYEWLALAQGRLKLGQIAEGLTAYERALHLDPSLAGDSQMLAGLHYFAEKDSSCEQVLQFAGQKLGATGADLIFNVWSATSRTTRYTKKAKDLLEDERVRNNMSQPLRLAIDLRRARDCDDVKELLPQILTDGDERSLTRLMELTKTVGCGADKKQDCYACLRDGSSLREAIAGVQTRRAPRFGAWH